MKLLMKIVKSSLNEIDVFGTRQETRAIVGVAADSFTDESLNKFLESNEQDIRNFSRERLYAK